MTFYGMKIKKRLIELGMTQKELGKIVGVDETYISKIIAGVKGGWKHREKINKILWGNHKLEKAI